MLNLTSQILETRRKTFHNLRIYISTVGAANPPTSGPGKSGRIKWRGGLTGGISDRCRIERSCDVRLCVLRPAKPAKPQRGQRRPIRRTSGASEGHKFPRFLAFAAPCTPAAVPAGPAGLVTNKVFKVISLARGPIPPELFKVIWLARLALLLTKYSSRRL